MKIAGVRTGEDILAAVFQGCLRLVAADEPTAGRGAPLRSLRHDSDRHAAPQH